MFLHFLEEKNDGDSDSGEVERGFVECNKTYMYLGLIYVFQFCLGSCDQCCCLRDTLLSFILIIS